MREVKKPEVRRAEILEASKKLFFEKGYQNTTTQDIINELKFSRGLLYYHFKSKEDILYHIIEDHVKPMILKFNTIVYDKKISTPEKVRLFIDNTITPQSAELNKINESLQEAVELPGNNYMTDKISHNLSYSLVEYFTEILKQGNADGTLCVENPEEVSTFLMTGFIFVMNDKHFHGNDEKRAYKLFESFKIMLNQTLGSKEKIFKI